MTLKADIDHIFNVQLFTELQNAIFNYDINKITRLAFDGADVSYPAHINSCVTRSFKSDNDIKILKTLIKHGADINSITTESLEFLILSSPCSDMLKELLKAGLILTDDTVPFNEFLHTKGLPAYTTPLDYMSSTDFDPKQKAYCLSLLSK